ncbi:MAG TPA: isoprenylcysteine carboxylmethyltransferase family protein [Methylomirabilota bacterium]|nr:isoprenylcysteine carboxylmethyltransferase family protein [Methylomirabilota bacterium]
MTGSSRLLTRLILWTIFTLVLFGAALFLPAGTWRFWQAWVYLALTYIFMIPFGIYFYKRDPQMLERRMQMKEKMPEQKLIMRFAKLSFLLAFVLPGFDRRFRWSHEPLWLTILAQAIMIVGFLFASSIPIVNRYASRTIQVESGQHLISTGPYRVVRHPMYLGMLATFLFLPLALGSYWSLPVFALIAPILVLRLLNEEKVLRRDLPGYEEYCRQTRFHLIPYVW